MKTTIRILAAASVLAVHSAEAAFVPAVYLVEERPLRAAAAGTRITAELFTDAACTNRIGSTGAIDITRVELLERVKTLRPAGAVRDPKYVRMRLLFDADPTAGDLYVKVTSPVAAAITPYPVDCQIQQSLALGGTGAQGSAGPQGPQGPIGATGLKGATGAKGDTGATGSTGPQGPIGPGGDAGAQGPVGSVGKTAVSGVSGRVVVIAKGEDASDQAQVGTSRACFLSGLGYRDDSNEDDRFYASVYWDSSSSTSQVRVETTSDDTEGSSATAYCLTSNN